MDGLKREPSSLNQLTTAMLNRGCPACSGRGPLLHEPERRVGRGEHAVRAVVASRRRLGIHVGTHHHEGGTRHGLVQAPLVAGPVEPDGEALGLQQAGEPLPLLAVRHAGGLAFHAAVLGSAEFAHDVEVPHERGVAGAERGLSGHGFPL